MRADIRIKPLGALERRLSVSVPDGDETAVETADLLLAAACRHGAWPPLAEADRRSLRERLVEWVAAQRHRLPLGGVEPLQYACCTPLVEPRGERQGGGPRPGARPTPESETGSAGPSTGGGPAVGEGAAGRVRPGRKPRT